MIPVDICIQPCKVLKKGGKRAVIEGDDGVNRDDVIRARAQVEHGHEGVSTAPISI